MELSYSQIRSWKRCKRRWNYAYKQGLKPVQRIAKVELGKYGHYLLEQYYKGNDISEASNDYWEAQTVDMFQEEKDEFVETRRQAEDMVQRYIDHYAGGENWEILGVEEDFKVNIPTKKGNASWDYLRGVIDLIVRDETGEIWLVDHKFTGTDLLKYEDGLVLDEQANYYLWALRQMLDSGAVSGIIFNLIRTKEPTVPKPLKKGGLSKAKNIDTTPEIYLQAIKDNGLDPDDYQDMLEYLEETHKPFFKQHKVYRTSEELDQVGEELYDISKDIRKGGNFRNATKDCSWDCPFYELCIMDAKNQDTTYYREQQFVTKEG